MRRIPHRGHVSGQFMSRQSLDVVEEGSSTSAVPRLLLFESDEAVEIALEGPLPFEDRLDRSPPSESG